MQLKELRRRTVGKKVTDVGLLISKELEELPGERALERGTKGVCPFSFANYSIYVLFVK